MSTAKDFASGVRLPRREPSESKSLPPKQDAKSEIKDKTCPSLTHDAPLRFINSTHPSEVKSLQNRKLIKQHAMLDAQQRRREASASNTSKKRAIKAAHAASTMMPPRQLLPKGRTSSASESSSDAASEMPHTPTPDYIELQDHDSRETAVSISGTNMRLLLTDEESPAILRYPGWSSVDPFRSLPQFANPLIRVEKLQYLNKAFFPTIKRSQFYVNALISNPLVLLSDAHPGMILQDALDGNAFGGNVTIASKGEIYSLLNKYLRSPNPAVQASRHVIAGIFNLIWLELSYGNLAVVQTHMQGLKRVFEQVGAISRTFDPNLLVMSVYQGLETAIYFEIPASVADLRLAAKLIQQHDDTASTKSVWESPINGDDFSRARASRLCNSHTVHILQQVQQLTARYLDGNHDASSDPTVAAFLRTTYQELLDMTNADTAFTISTNATWIHECVRLTAIIWVTAMIEMVPISHAALMVTTRLPDLADPVQSLLRALKKTDTKDCWNDMIGTFMWVVKVGCVAAPTGSVLYKWFYLEVARATVLGLRNQQHADVLYGCTVILRIQATLRKHTTKCQTYSRESG